MPLLPGTLHLCNVQGEKVDLDFFPDEISAARCHDIAAWEAFGASAQLNFPRECPSPTSDCVRSQLPDVSHGGEHGHVGLVSNVTVPGGNAAGESPCGAQTVTTGEGGDGVSLRFSPCLH
jgi:hypothetical protein